jgi:acyl-CoA hydrolase
MSLLQTKTPRDSQMETRYLVMPQHANDLGIVFGGTIMSWIDALAGMVAQKHCERKVLTVSTDRISFLAPVHIGDHVVLRASVNYVGTTSLEVGVQVMRDNPYTRDSVRATTAYLTFVGVDDAGRPTAVNLLKPETPDENRRHENAKLRVQSRKELLQKLKLKA